MESEKLDDTFSLDDVNQEVTSQNKPVGIAPAKPPPITKKDVGRPSVWMPVLNEAIEDILELILQGWTFRELSAKFGCPAISFHYWRRNGPYSKEVEAAMELSAECYVDKAEEVLLDSLDQKDIANAKRLGDLSKFYQWKASKRQPKIFGNKEEVSITVEQKHNVSDEQFNMILTSIMETSKPKENDATEYQDAEEIH